MTRLSKAITQQIEVGRCVDCAYIIYHEEAMSREHNSSANTQAVLQSLSGPARREKLYLIHRTL